MTEAVQQWSGSVHSSTRQIVVVWVSRGKKLIRCHPIPLRRCSEGEVSIASLNSLVQISMPTSVTELTNALSPGQNEDLSASLPTGDDLRFGEVDLGDPPVGQETMAPSFVPLFYPLAPWSIRCKTHLLACHPVQTLFLNMFVVILMYQLTSLPWHLVRCRLLHVT